MKQSVSHKKKNESPYFPFRQRCLLRLVTNLNDPTATVKANISVDIRDWPVIPPAVLSDSIVQNLGPVFFFCSVMVIFINVLNQVVSEKEAKLRHGMEMMGLKVRRHLFPIWKMGWFYAFLQLISDFIA